MFSCRMAVLGRDLRAVLRGLQFATIRQFVALKQTMLEEEEEQHGDITDADCKAPENAGVQAVCCGLGATNEYDYC